jgi:hypothetical protein
MNCITCNRLIVSNVIQLNRNMGCNVLIIKLL